jgi:hypothetical protein
MKYVRKMMERDKNMRDAGFIGLARDKVSYLSLQ